MTNDNPFEYDTPITIYEAIKIFLFSVTLILPLRLLLFVLTLCAATLICFVVTLGVDKEVSVKTKPFISWRKFLISSMPYFSRFLLFLLGFWYIKINGKVDKRASFIVPNHMGFIDVFVVYYIFGCTAISRAENFDLPFFGSIFTALQIIPVKRENPESRQKTKAIMESYIRSHRNPNKDERFPNILIFPEGTTHKDTHLLMFQKGAFVFGAPVQPVALKFSYKNFNPSWIVSKTSDLFALRTFCQFNQTLTVNLLPIYYPNDKEKSDAVLYANNVRQQIAYTLGARITNHWYEDVKLLTEAVELKEELDKQKMKEEVNEYVSRTKEKDKARLKHLSKVADIPALNQQTEKLIQTKSKVQGKLYYFRRFVKILFFNHDKRKQTTIDLSTFEMQEIRRIFKDKESHLQEIMFLLRKFVEVDNCGNGFLSYSDFCSVLGLTDSRQTKNLFTFFDTKQVGKLEFKDLALGLAYCSSSVNSEQKRRLAFDLYDNEGNGTISLDQFSKMLHFGNENEAAKLEVASIIERTKILLESKSDNHKISWDLFNELSRKEPYIVDHVLFANDTGWCWNIKKTMEQLGVNKKTM